MTDEKVNKKMNETETETGAETGSEAGVETEAETQAGNAAEGQNKDRAKTRVKSKRRSKENSKESGENSSASDKRADNGRSTFMDKIRKIAAVVLILLALICVIKLVSYISGTSRTHLSDEGYTHAARFEKCIVVNGIDVSEHQGEIKWKKVKSSEADFAFIRAGYRTLKNGELNEDANFKDNIKKANRAGIMTGAYFFSQALNADEAVEEADFLIDLVKKYELDMPLAIDFELYEGGRLEKAVQEGKLPAASMYHDIVLAFCDRVEKEGYESAVYANYNVLTNYMDSTTLDDKAVIWAAQYSSKCDVKGGYRFWQCAEDAVVGGIDVPVDHDFWYIEPGRVYKTNAKAKKDAVSIGRCGIEFNKDVTKLSNHRAEPVVSVTYHGKKLKEGKNYKLGFVHNCVKGTGYAIVRGIKKYKDWIAVPFAID